jgi:hypothetical protein
MASYVYHARHVGHVARLTVREPGVDRSVRARGAGGQQDLKSRLGRGPVQLADAHRARTRGRARQGHRSPRPQARLRHRQARALDTGRREDADRQHARHAALQQAYELVRDPVYLFNIAQSYRKVADCENSFDYDTQYLRAGVALYLVGRTRVEHVIVSPTDGGAAVTALLRF